MARARNIKPAFFDNDELAELEPLARLLFIGLWTLADFKGDLEWREKRIKKQVLAYDDCDIKKLAINLDKSGFVRFYSDQDKIYLNIVNFGKHQNPHKNEREKGSEIPEYSESMRQVIDLKELTINHDKSGLIPNNSDSNRADSLNLIPDSLNPITDSPTPVIEEKPVVKQKRFTPPKLSDVKEYCLERKNQVNPENFINHYEATNWYRGKTKMKDWKAAVRTWENNSYSKPAKPSSHNLSGKVYESGDL